MQIRMPAGSVLTNLQPQSHKTISFGPETKYVPVKMYGSIRCKLTPIPENIPINPFNHTFDRKDFSPAKKVVLRIKEDIHKMKERMCLSEHPLGTVKWYHGAHYLLCKGKEKATAELGLVSSIKYSNEISSTFFPFQYYAIQCTTLRFLMGIVYLMAT